MATVRRNTTIDWAEKESVRAKLRLMVKRILRRYGYPPDKQEKATRTVLEQAELLSAAWGVEPPEEVAPRIQYPAAEEHRSQRRAVAERRSDGESEGDGRPETSTS